MEFVDLINIGTMGANLQALVAFVGGLLAVLPLLLGMGDVIANPKVSSLGVEEAVAPVVTASAPLPLSDGGILLPSGQKVPRDLLEAPPIPPRWASAQPEEDDDEDTVLVLFPVRDLRMELQEVHSLLQQSGLLETGLPGGVLRDARTGKFVSRRALAL